MVAVLKERECLDKETKDAKKRGQSSQSTSNKVGKERCKATPCKVNQKQACFLGVGDPQGDNALSIPKRMFKKGQLVSRPTRNHSP
jgi:hypothetical protein